MKPIRVLLADDHVLMREGMRGLLAAAGIEVVAEAGTGREALARAAEFDPDLVLMDVAMPDMNGIEAAAQLRSRAPRPRVIVISMFGDAEHVHRALEAGAAGYLLKDSAAAELIAAVREVHAGRRYFSDAVSERVRSFAASRPGPLASLSVREREVLQGVVEGKTSAQIAAQMHLSPKTVETYRSRLMRKLGVEDLAALVKFAVQHGITPPA